MQPAPERIDCAVIGAGVIGLAVARALALAGRDVVVLEASGGIGTGTSSRNSEVIHAGIYYPAGSLKARLCVAGKALLYRFLESRRVPYRTCGKLIVAASQEQRPKLAELQARAARNGVADLRWLDGAQVRELEPEVRAAAGLLSPSTGILDSHALMLALQGEAEDAGAMLALHAPVEGGGPGADGVRLQVGGRDPMTLDAGLVVNAAGLAAVDVAARLMGPAARHLPSAHYAKGCYFTLAGRAPFRRLIYPVPEAGGLGVHVTLDLGGQCRFGPDVSWVAAPDYTVPADRAAAFESAVRRYWPGLPDGALQPGYAGVRPKLAGPGAADADFVVQGPEVHGVPGLINLLGIESPGLTASLAIARTVAHRAGLAPRDDLDTAAA